MEGLSGTLSKNTPSRAGKYLHAPRKGHAATDACDGATLTSASAPVACHTAGCSLNSQVAAQEHLRGIMVGGSSDIGHIIQR